MHDSILDLEDVRFGYGSGPDVLAGVDAQIRPGSVVGIVGPSGCGKSTLLALIAGLRQVRSGAITIRDRSNGSSHLMSMVFQKDTLLPWLTVEENVQFFSRFEKHGLKRSQKNSERRQELDERTKTLLSMVNLEDRGDAYPYQLSGGMRRRVQFLAGVAPRPQILLLDEPFSSVDEPTRIRIHQEAFEIITSMRMTVILVTHDLAEAISLCDRVLILSNRPATIAHDHVIPFGKQRDVLGLRKQPDFLELYGSLWDDLSRQIGATPDVPMDADETS